MKIGMILPRVDPGGRPMTKGTLVAAARRIESHGFDSGWITDSIGRGLPNPDPLMAVAVAASVTERISVGTGILQVPIRNPVELAQRVMTTHLLAGDRLDLGIGAGSSEADFVATGTRFDARFRTFADSVALMRRLWAGETVDGVCITPWEDTIGGPRLLVGSWSGSEWVPRAAREFDGWIGSAKKSSWEQIENGLSRYRDAGGKRAVILNIDIDFDAPDEPDASMADATLHLGACGPGAAAARIARFTELGFDEIVLRTKEHTDESVARVAALAGR